MHELSVATKIMEIVADHTKQFPEAEVVAIYLQIGQLSCVHDDPLRFCFRVVAEGTNAASAELRISRLPVSVYCQACQTVVELPGIQAMKCPECGSLCDDLRGGDELEVESIEILEDRSVEAD